MIRINLVGKLALAMAACASISSIADIVIITSRPAGGDPGVTPCPPYCEIAGNWANSTLKSSAPGAATTRAGSRFATQATASFSVSPTLAQMNGTYYVETTHGSATSISADLIVSVTTAGATGLPETTDGFQQTKGVGAWHRLGTITLDGTTASPTITFTYASGAASRFYADAFRFINTNDVCLTGLPQLTTVNGPLAAGQTFVNVPAVDATATNVTVYAYNETSSTYTKLGELTAGIVAGVNAVPTSALVKGQTIIASQWKGGVESCLATSGPEVGGLNPAVRVSLGVRDVAGLPEMIGADAGTAGIHLVLLKANGTLNGGFGVAPTGGQVVSPGNCWQTLTFDRATDEIFGWSGPYGANTLPNDFVALDAIAFAIEDTTDTGPFVVYLDNFINGTTLIQDFEAATNGEPAVLINLPSFSTTTSPYLLSPAPGTISPNISVVTNLNASAGTNSLMLSWQFKDSSGQDWYRATFQGSRTPNPIVDLRQPISFDLLMLPAGQSLGNMNVSLLKNQVVQPGQSATFSVTTTGTGPFTYVWKTNDVEITSVTGNTLALNNLQLGGGGVVSVSVNNGSCGLVRKASLIVANAFSLSVARDSAGLVLTWDAALGDSARLEKTSSLIAPIAWRLVDAVAQLEGNSYVAHLPIGIDSEFFRLRQNAP
jgi:hypothetical protein